MCVCVCVYVYVCVCVCLCLHYVTVYTQPDPDPPHPSLHALAFTTSVAKQSLGILTTELCCSCSTRHAPAWHSTDSFWLLPDDGSAVGIPCAVVIPYSVVIPCRNNLITHAVVTTFLSAHCQLPGEHIARRMEGAQRREHRQAILPQHSDQHHTVGAAYSL